MKLLQVIDFMPETSGGARFVVNLALQLKEKGVDVDVLLIDGVNSHFIDQLRGNDINVICLDFKVNRFNPKYASMISMYLDKYDVVHVHIFPSSYQVALAKIINKKSAPIVFTEHNSFNRRASNPLFKYIEKFIYSKFNHIVCLSQQVFSFVDENLKIDHKKLSIIENAIDSKKIDETLAANKHDFKLIDSDFTLLMSARFTTQKNHQVVIESLKFLPEEIKILFAGDGILLDKMKALVLSSGLENRVSFLGSRADIFSLMKMVDVNILASNFEGLSLAALEAMSTGKPFIGSNVDGLDFVIDNKDYLFENEPEDLSKLILKLYNDKGFYNRASIDAYSRSKDFDLETMADKYLDIYREQIR